MDTRTYTGTRTCTHTKTFYGGSADLWPLCSLSFTLRGLLVAVLVAGVAARLTHHLNHQWWDGLGAELTDRRHLELFVYEPVALM